MRDQNGKFVQGHAKVGGRRKGTRNSEYDLYGYLKSHGLDPAKRLLEKLKADDVKVETLLKVLEYCYPKIRATESPVIPSVPENSYNPSSSGADKPKLSDPVDLSKYGFLLKPKPEPNKPA